MFDLVIKLQGHYHFIIIGRMASRSQRSLKLWASRILKREVLSLSEIQSVQTLQSFLTNIDPIRFPSFAPFLSYQQTLDKLIAYFLTYIRFDLSEMVDSLNVYKDPYPLWQIIFALAIKGANRDWNINQILKMEQIVQNELMGLIEDIFQKFGSDNVQPNSKIQKSESSDDNKDKEEKESKFIFELNEEYEALKEKYEQLKEKYDLNLIQLEGEKRNIQNLQDKLDESEKQKNAFFQILSNLEYSPSTQINQLVFTGNYLPQVAHDITSHLKSVQQTILTLQKSIQNHQERCQTYKKGMRRLSDENEGYKEQIKEIQGYERQIQRIRSEVIEGLQREKLMQKQIAEVEQQKFYLASLISRKQAKNDQISKQLNHSQSKQAQFTKKEESYRKKSIKNGGLLLGQSRESEVVSSIDQHTPNSFVYPSATIHSQMDQLHSPQLRTKLQREINHLKELIEQLRGQNAALRRANQMLQRSAGQFVEQHVKIREGWEKEYEDVVGKMQIAIKIAQSKNVEAEIQRKQTQINRKKAKSNEQQIERNKEKIQNITDQNQKIKRQAQQKQSKLQEAQQKIEQNQRKREQLQLANKNLQETLQKKEQQMAQQSAHEDSQQSLLWREIILHVQQMISHHKQKEIAMQGTINHLKMQNMQLVEHLRTAIQHSIQNGAQIKNPPQEHSKRSQAPIDQPISQIKIHAPQPKNQSFVDLQEGEDLEEEPVTRNFGNRSSFFKMDSVILGDLKQKQLLQSVQEEQQYYGGLNQQLRQHLFAGMEELQKQLTACLTESTAQHYHTSQLQSTLTVQLAKLSQQYATFMHHLRELPQKKSEVEQQSKYGRLLQEIVKAERQGREDIQSEIGRLRVTNQVLKGRIKEQLIWKEQMSVAFKKIEQQLKQMLANQLNPFDLSSISNLFQAIQFPLPSELLTFPAESSNEQDFRRMYLHTQQKCQQMEQQLEIMCAVLLEYRNCLEFQ